MPQPPNNRNITFLPVLTHGRSTRDKELETAEIRAHTAKFTHQRRKQRQAQQQQLTPNHVETDDFLRRYYLSQGRLVTLHGSSDPFSASSIEITPQVNHIVRLARDVLLPSYYLSRYVRRLSLGAPRQFSYESLHLIIGGRSVLGDVDQFRQANEGIALAWLSSHIPTVVDLFHHHPSNDLSILGLRMRTRSLNLLREELSQNPERDQNSLWLAVIHIMLHFKSDCRLGDTPSARVHGTMALRLIENLEDDTRVIPELLKLVFNSSEMASKTLKRTVVPFDDTMTNRLTNFWRSISVTLPRLDSVPGCTSLHSCVDSAVLRTIFVRLRYCLTIGERPFDVSDPEQKRRGDLLYAWMATQTLYDIGVLVNLYVDLVEEKMVLSSKSRQLTETCLTLALLHVLRKTLHAAEVEGGDIRDASFIIIPRLEQDLKTALEILTEDNRLEYQEAYLWMFWVGAHHEQSLKMGTPAASEAAGPSWFGMMLARQARRLNVQTWPRAEKTIEMFLYDNYQEPRGEGWYEDIVRECDDDGEDDSSLQHSPQM